MVRTYRNNNASSLGGVFESGPLGGAGERSSHLNYYEASKASTATFSSSPSPDDFSPTPSVQSKSQHHPCSHCQLRDKANKLLSMSAPPYHASSPQLNVLHNLRSRAPPQPPPPEHPPPPPVHTHGRDTLGNIFILPRQMDLGLCQGCKKLYGAQHVQHQYQHSHLLQQQPVQQHQQVVSHQCAHRARGSVDYDDLLNQKRIEENKYRNSADPFVNGGLKMSSSEGFLNRVNDAPPGNEDFGLASGLNDLSTVLARLQANVDDESGIGSGSMSYPNSANIPNTNMGRKTWSAPQSDPFGFNGVNSVMPPVNMRGGPGEGPTYGRAAKVQAEMAMATGSLGDPLQHLHGQGNGSSPYDGYSPSVYDGQKPTKRGGRESYLKELEMQIAEQKARKQREQANQMDWWEKREEQPFKVNVPQRPHPSQQPKPTADQRPDPKNGQKSLQEELRLQMDMKKMREAEERQRELEEEAKLERRIQEQQDRMKREYDEEQNKKKAKEQAKLKRQEEMAKRQKELQKEAEQQRKEVAEKKFQERKAARQRREEQDALERHGDSSDHSTPGPGVRSNSPPLPALRKSGGNSSSDIMEASSSTSVGLSSAGEEDDQDAALGQLTKMREQLEKKKDELDVMDEEPKTPNRGRRRSSIWEGLAEV